ncbi:MAG: glycosyltransferase family 39 protein [Candidatus Binatia bacterium]
MKAILAALVAAVTLGLYFYGAHGFALADPDEARYGEIAREMRLSGDWTTPTLNGVIYLEKPPLVYWATAASNLAFGPAELATRLPTVAAALLTLLLAALLARRLYDGRTALLATAILAWGPLFGFLAIVLTLDMSLTACLTAAMGAVWCAWSGGGDRRWVRVAYAATALGILVKGPVAAVLVGSATLLFVLTAGGWRALRPWLDWRALGLAAAIVLPWFLLVGWRNPGFWDYFIVDQHLHRYTSTKEHGEPFWYFAPVVLAGLMPWSLALLFDPGLWRGALDPRRWAPRTRFLVLWAGVILGFFSLSISKLPTYALPALPPLALLVARALLRGVEQGRTAGLRRAAWFLLVAGPVLGVVAALLPHVSHHFRVPLLVPYLLAAAVPLAATGFATGRVLVARRPYAALVVFAAGWLRNAAVAVGGREVASEYPHRPRARRPRRGTRPGDRLVLYHNFVQSMVFYSQRRGVMVGGAGEHLRLHARAASRRGSGRATPCCTADSPAPATWCCSIAAEARLPPPHTSARRRSRSRPRTRRCWSRIGSRRARCLPRGAQRLCGNPRTELG